MHLPILIVVGALLNAGMLVSRASAQAAPPEQSARVRQREDEADAQFARGEALYASRQLGAAIEAFTASYRLVPTANLAFNIAQTSELLERIEDAFNWYQVSLAFPGDETARRAQERIAALSPQVAAVAVTAQPSDSLIAIDDVEQGASTQSPRVLAVTPGRHRLSARRAGCVSGETIVEGQRGSIVAVSLSLEPLPGTLTVESMPAGATVLLRPQMGLLGITPLNVRLPVGQASLLLRLAGHVDREVTTQIRSDAVTMLSLSFVQHTASGPYRTDADPRRSALIDADPAPTQGLGNLRWVGYGTAAALVVAGGVLSVFAFNKHDEVEADPERRGDDELTRLNVATDLTIGTGLLLGAVTLVLDLTLPDSTVQRRSAP